MKTNKVKILILALLASLVMLTECVATETAKAEDKVWQFHNIVDVEFVQQYVKMPKPADVLIIDSRPKKPKFDKGYIPTAICIPGKDFAKMTDRLPKNKNALLIFYCQGPT